MRCRLIRSDAARAVCRSAVPWKRATVISTFPRFSQLTADFRKPCGADPSAPRARAESERESLGLLQAMDHWDRTRQDGPLTIRMEQAGDLLTVHVIGELGRSTAKTFEAELRLAISGDASTVVLDLGDVHFIDSTGLRSVVRIANQSLRAGARLRMRRTSPSVQQALEGGGLEHLLPLVD